MMRYFTYEASVQLVREFNIAGAVRRIVHDGGDIIHLELITGQSLMIYLIEAPIPLYEIRNITGTNTANGHYTLFILWGALLLPDDGRLVELEDWHDALLGLYGDRIYAYEVHRGHLYIHAIHFEPVGRPGWARVRHGETVDVGALAVRVVTTSQPDFAGGWRVAAFDGDPEYFHRQQARQMQTPRHDELLAYYQLLQVEPDADFAAVKAAYRRLARQHHPDTNVDDPDAHARMQALNHAYNAILKAREGSG